MARELTPRELDELLGAYALDAVDGDERAQVEAWLERSPEARAELASLRETAALLTQPARAAPPGVWARIEDALSETPPPLVLPSGRRRLAVRATAALAAASAAAAAITAVVLSDEMAEQEHRLESVAQSVREDGMRRAATAAMADPRARILELSSPAGAAATLVAMPDGEAYLVAVRLPRLARGRTYQLWAMTDGGASVVSAGVVGRDVEAAALHVPAGVEGFAVTAEDAPGADRPHHPMVLEGWFD
jgi:hypothetical protein